MSVQEHLDSLVWAAAPTSAVSNQEAATILKSLEALAEAALADLPGGFAKHRDELLELTKKAIDGDSGAAEGLRELLRTALVDEGGEVSASPSTEQEDDETDGELLEMFLVSSAEALAEIESALIQLDTVAYPSLVKELVESLQRDIHTLKGECGVLSLHAAQEVWHEVESLVGAAVAADKQLDSDLSIRALDWHREYLAVLGVDDHAKPPAYDKLIKQLRATTEAVENEDHADSELITFSADVMQDDTVPEFVVEARQHLEDSEAALFELESDSTSTDGIDRIFRAFHTIKGVAGFLDLTPITDLAHAVETLLDRFRGTGLEFTSAHADVVLESKDAMDRLLGTLMGEEGPSVSGLARLTAHVKLVSDDPEAAKPMAARSIRKVLADVGIRNEEEMQDAALHPARTGSKLGAILVAKGALTEDQLDSALAKQKELSAAGKEMRLGELLVILGVVSAGDLSSALEMQTEGESLGKLLRTEVAPAKDEVQPKKRAKYDSTIRVSTQRLDGLVDMVGELVIAQQMVVQGTETMNSGDGDHLQRNLAHLGKITRDLQEASMSLRMVTFQSTFQKMHRLVRDVSSRAGKSVRLELHGADTEVDRNVVDKISDPLVHLVRNAIDHGLEPSDEREANGKNPQGLVELSARHQGGSIVISLKDDGRGLNRTKILAKAKENGLIPPERDVNEMSDDAVFKLIFAPGFSTAAAVTDISGRGVGMDVVKRNIEAMRGKVEIVSQPGKGSEFLVQLPLTLAIIDAMIVRSGTERYVIPTLSIVQSFQPSEEQLHAVRGGQPMVEVRGQLVPLHSLEKLLNGGFNMGQSDSTTLILVEGMGRRVCFAVDEIIGQQQVVIKKLGPCVPQDKVVSGGAILGDGRVALIIDIEGILARSESVALV